MDNLFQKSNIRGEGNDVSSLTARGNNSNLDIAGDRNTVKIGSNCKVADATFILDGNRTSLILEDGVRFTGRIKVSGDGAQVIIGRNTTFERIGIVCIEGAKVIIGEDCMFSFGVEIRTSDAHSILDLETRKRINRPGDVIVGNHVWVGANTTLNKGIRIASDVIVGIRAVVTKDIEEEHCAVAGIPAKIVRSGITWDRKLIPLEDTPVVW